MVFSCKTLVNMYKSTSSQFVQDNLSCCKIPYLIPQDIEHGCMREEAFAPCHADVEEEEAEGVENVQAGFHSLFIKPHSLMGLLTYLLFKQQHHCKLNRLSKLQNHTDNVKGS